MGWYRSGIDEGLHIFPIRGQMINVLSFVSQSLSWHSNELDLEKWALDQTDVGLPALV